MSNQSRRTNNSCSFCHDQGHHIKNCHVLANTECKKCNGRGHTTRRCNARMSQNKQYRRRTGRGRIVVNQNGWSTVGISPVEAAPVKAAPVKAAPVKAAPVKAPPVKAEKWPTLRGDPDRDWINYFKPKGILPMLKRKFKKGERWADICDMEDELNCPDEVEQHILVLKNNIHMMKKYHAEK